MSTADAIAALAAVCQTERMRRLVTSTADNFPAYVNAVWRQEAAARGLREGTVTREEAEETDRARRRAHDLAQYSCIRLNRMADRVGLVHPCPEVPEPDAPGGRDPRVRDAVAGYAARVALDRFVSPDEAPDLSGRELLAHATGILDRMPDNRFAF